MNSAGRVPPAVLLVHSGAIGDFILSLRVVQAIRMSGASRVGVLGRGFYSQLAGRPEGVDELLNIETGGFHTLFDSARRTPPEIGSRLAEYMLAVDMLGGETLSTRLRDAGIERVIQVDSRPRPDWTGHVTDQWLDALAALGISEAPPFVEIRPAAAVPSSIALVNRRTTMLHPGSGSVSKCWPLHEFAKVARELIAAGNEVCFLLGEAERERLSARDISFIGSIGPILPEQDLDVLAAILARLRCFIGNDSGISHLAAAVGTRTITVFGPTNPTTWRPLGPHAAVVYEHGGWPGAQAVLAEWSSTT